MSFCGNCGTKLTEDQDFCPECGSRVRGGTSASQTGQEPVTPSANVPMADTPASRASVDATDSEASLQKLATLRTQTPPTKKSGSKVLVVILLCILLAVAAVIGGGVYLAYRVKQKATAVLNKLEAGG